MASKTDSYSPRCTICRHPQRDRIDLAKARGATNAEVAQRFGVSLDAVFRHWRDHVPGATKAALAGDGFRAQAEAQEALAENDIDVVEHLHAVRARLARCLAAAEERGDARMVASLSREMASVLVTIGKQNGQLRRLIEAGPSVNVAVGVGSMGLRQFAERVVAGCPAARPVVETILSEMAMAEGEAAALAASGAPGG